MTSYDKSGSTAPTQHLCLRTENEANARNAASVATPHPNKNGVSQCPEALMGMSSFLPNSKRPWLNHTSRRTADALGRNRRRHV